MCVGGWGEPSGTLVASETASAITTEMASQSQGIQQLLQAEKRAAEKVADARKSEFPFLSLRSLEKNWSARGQQTFESLGWGGGRKLMLLGWLIRRMILGG